MSNEDPGLDRRRIKSFVIRSGRMTSSQQHAYDEGLARWGIDTGSSDCNWQRIFGNDKPVTVEIGFGMGDSLATLAAAQPDNNFVGIEVHTPGIGRLLALVEKLSLDNVRVIEGDAVTILEQYIPDHSIDTCNIYFPDPWHKKKHHKRRLLQDAFVATLASKLRSGGTLHVATDWENYAEEIIATLERAPGFDRLAIEKDAPISQRRNRPDTKFERRGQRIGHSVWDIIFSAR